MFMKKKKVVSPVVKIEPTSGALLEQADYIVEKALNMFSVAVDSINNANELITKAMEKDIKDIERLEEEMKNVTERHLNSEETINANLELKKKLTQFVR